MARPAHLGGIVGIAGLFGFAVAGLASGASPIHTLPIFVLVSLSLVVGLSTRWHAEGLGGARLRLAREAVPPTLLVRRGLRPGGLAPPAALTRFTWSLGPQVAQAGS